MFKLMSDQLSLLKNILKISFRKSNGANLLSFWSSAVLIETSWIIIVDGRHRLHIASRNSLWLLHRIVKLTDCIDCLEIVL